MYLMSCTCIGAGNMTSELCVCLREQNRFHSPFPVIPLTIISEYIVTMFSIRYSSRLAFRHAFSLADFHEDLRNLINKTRNTRFRTNSHTFAVYRNVLPFCAGIFVKNLVIYAIISLNSFKSNVEILVNMFVFINYGNEHKYWAIYQQIFMNLEHTLIQM